MPATRTTVVPFLELMSLSVSYGHLKHLISAIKFHHQASGFTFPEHDFDICNTLHGLKRKLARTPNQALPITPAIMRAMYKKLNMGNARDRALWCSYLVTFYCLFRKSNSVPKSLSRVDMKRTLLRRHIWVDDATNTVLVYVSFSKTIHFGNKYLVIPIPGNSDEAMDLVRHMRALLNTVKCPPESPAFTYSSGKFITYSTFTTSLKRLLGQAGYNPRLYTGHSFRRGGATLLYRLGASILQIQISGDWSSQCFARYLHVSEDDRREVQQLVADAISAGLD